MLSFKERREDNVSSFKDRRDSIDYIKRMGLANETLL
jgi:hypothetical protein